MTKATMIEHAYHVHDHDLFMAELGRLLADKERLDYLEGQRQKLGARGFNWDTFVFRNGPDDVRKQIDDERKPHPAWERLAMCPPAPVRQALPLVHRWLSVDAQAGETGPARGLPVLRSSTEEGS